MRYLKCLGTAACLLLTVHAFAHTKLQSSVPADAAVVTSLESVVLTFSAAVRLTSVIVRSKSGVAANIGEWPRGAATSFTVPLLENLPPGSYQVVWRSISADTHVVSGEFGFLIER